jgi:hypothetical protein
MMNVKKKINNKINYLYKKRKIRIYLVYLKFINNISHLIINIIILKKIIN